MPNVRQILTRWSTPSGAGKVTVMYFDADADVAVQRERIRDLFVAICAGLSNQVRFTVDTSGVELDAATGTLTGAWAETTIYSALGAVAGNPAADATQLLLRWKTEDIVNGRFVVGRTFVPGLLAVNLVNGNVNPAAIAIFQTAVDAFVASVAAFRVWHRPITSSGGSAHNVTAGEVWSELAVLRRRRG